MAARYWWQCLACDDRPAWLATCKSRSIAAFIWDELAPAKWDQRLLRRQCAACGSKSLYLTYRLKRGDPDRVSVKHIVGLALEDDYMPMLWETFRHSCPRTKWVDFKDQRGRSPWGLTKRLVLKRTHLSALLQAYDRASGARLTPAPNLLSS
jgi:hypothetical protein